MEAHANALFASLIGRLVKSFRAIDHAVSMSLTGSCFSLTRHQRADELIE